MILNMLYIAVIVTLIWNSGFFEVLDSEINKRFKFHHLPHIFFCAYCGTWWSELFFVLLSGNLSFFNVMLCLLFAGSTNIINPLYKTIENFLLKIIELINRLIWNGEE